MVDVLGGAKSTGNSDCWLDQAIREIHKVREHHELVENVNTLRVQAEEIRKQLDSIEIS